MPAPPVEIRIKRKATDDPIDLLRVQNEVRGFQGIKPYYFKRQRRALDLGHGGLPSLLAQTPHSATSLIGASQAHRVQLFQEKNLERLDAENSVQPGDLSNNFKGRSIDGQIPLSSNGNIVDHGGRFKPSQILLPAVRKNGPRRFHLSRASPTGVASSPIRGEKGPHAVFVEQRHHTDLVPSSASSLELTNDFSPIAPQPSMESYVPESLLRNVGMPSGTMVPRDANSSTLAEDMQAYSSQEFGPKLTEVSGAQHGPSSSSVIRARQVSRFKPKAPALRYPDRNPTQDLSLEERDTSVEDEVMTDAGGTKNEEPGYIMDVYIRLPAEMFEHQVQENVGLLVLDSQPDIDEFYNDESDSDSEIFDEEEDENAENHPSTDYPEDEVDSDDEYGRNPYMYGNRNSSDIENFGEDDATYSDDGAKPPWARRPWMNSHSYRDADEGDDDE